VRGAHSQPMTDPYSVDVVLSALMPAGSLVYPYACPIPTQVVGYNRQFRQNGGPLRVLALLGDDDLRVSLHDMDGIAPAAHLAAPTPDGVVITKQRDYPHLWDLWLTEPELRRVGTFASPEAAQQTAPYTAAVWRWQAQARARVSGWGAPVLEVAVELVLSGLEVGEDDLRQAAVALAREPR